MNRSRRRRLGQHFLQTAWVERLVERIAPAPDETLLEIGAGRGALTLALAARGVRITAVEIDERLAAELAPRVPASVAVVCADFLRMESDRLPLGPTTRVVGNLPYSVAAPILLRLLGLSAQGARLRDATLMLQREVAERVVAAPGSPDWGPLAVATRMHAVAERLLLLPPGAFRPPPRVRSAVVQLRFCAPPLQPQDAALFDALVRALFTQRRKTALNALRPFAAQHSELPVAELFRRAGVDPRQRPGDLDLPALKALADTLAAAPGRTDAGSRDARGILEAPS